MTISDDLRRRILTSQANTKMRELINFRDYYCKGQQDENILLAAQLICEDPNYASLNPEDLANAFTSDILRAYAA